LRGFYGLPLKTNLDGSGFGVVKATDFTMAYFIPSNIQKRFLRYALSRLELLDNESLDLDQLDIAWGSRSSVELRDVKLNVEVYGNIVTNGINRLIKHRNYVPSSTFQRTYDQQKHAYSAFELPFRQISTEAALR